MDRRTNVRVDQPQPSPGSRLRALCNDRCGIHPPRHDPHHAQATCCKCLVMNPNFPDGLLETDFSFFSLFSLTEHITFALEAVPMATAAAALVLSQFQTDTWIVAGWSERRQRLYRLAQASFVFVLGSIMLYTTYPVLPQILIVIVTLAVFLIYLQAAKHQLTGMRI